MKRKLLFCLTVLTIIITACNNPFFPERKGIMPDNHEQIITNQPPVIYAVVIDISGDVSGDTVTASPDTGIEGDTVALAYTVENTAHYNVLDFSGVIEAVDSVNSAGNGERTYTINAADASNGVITITAVFTHTDLVIDPIEFSDKGHINKIYGDTFTNAIVAGHSGNGAITYSSSDTTVAAVDGFGQVTIHKAGSAVITAEKTADAVYAHAQTNYTLTVDPKPVTIIGLSADDKIHNGTTAATVTGTAVIDGLIGGDTVTVVEGTAAFEDAIIGDNKTVTFSGWSLGGADAGNYILSAQPASVTASITDLVIDHIAFTDTEGHIIKTYGDEAFTNAVTDAHKGSGVISYSSSDTDVAEVDDSGQVTILKAGSAVITAEKAADAVYAHAHTNYTLTVDPKPVTITGLSANNKVYNGTTAATITGTAVISGKIDGDTVTVSAGTAAFADKTVATGKTVTFSGYSLDGEDVDNYTLSEQPASVTANITAKPVTITGLSASNKVYNGTMAATVTGTAVINGKIDGDTVTVSAGTAAFANKTVGTGKTVTFSGYSLTGADAGNYTLSAQPASVTANITAKALTITGLSASNKTYDGATTATVTGTAALSGVVNGDTVTLGGTRTAVFANKNVGTAKAVTISGYTISGADAGNYSLTQPSLTANITAKALTITGLSASNKQYDGTTTATVTGTAVISGKISTDTVTVNAGTAAFANATVGNNKTVTFSGYSLTGTDAGNYTLSAQPASVTASINWVDIVSISAGTFTMGSPTSEVNRYSDETQHSVTLSSFKMGKYQVTQAQYQAVMGAGEDRTTTTYGKGDNYPAYYVNWYDAIIFCNKLSILEGLNPVYSIDGSTDPAVWIASNGGTIPTSINATWDAAVMDMSKNGYRLPTEAEWEYA